MICVTPLVKREEPPNGQGVTLQVYRNIIADECRMRKFPVIDGLTLVPNEPKYFDDDQHLNDVGHSTVGKNLAKALYEILKW